MTSELPAGTRLGPYEIESRIGAGGMGVVYRAHDPRLGRSVAIKLLPPFHAQDAEQRARFQREARTIAQLQHPNVCTLFDVGQEGENDFLVMELLDGETLAQRLERGALAFDQVVAIGAAVADALAAAHQRGILHRDLKPGNVMLTRSGPKLLDFGLAKLHSPPSPARPVHEQETRIESAISGEGVIVGTLAYMAPEQLEGRSLDARADLWALGCLLYEMASGRRPFQGASAASTMAAILEREPPSIAELVRLAPAAFDRLVRTCLAKDPDQRWQSAADLARQLRWLGDGSAAASGGANAVPAAPVAPPRSRAALRTWLGIAGGAVLALGGFAVGLRHAPATSRLPVRSTLIFQQRQLDPFSVVPQISPDGRFVVVGSSSSTWGEPLHLLALEAEEPRTLPGTEGAALPFWSPDGRSIAYFQEHRLVRLDLDRGTPVVLATFDDDPRGGAWSAQGVLLVSPGRTGGLVRISANGGPVEPVTTLDPARKETTHRFPVFLPDGQRFLYWASANNATDKQLDSLRLGSLAGGNSQLVLEHSNNGVVVGGYLLTATPSRSGLFAWPFDATTGKTTGEAVSVAHSVFYGYGISFLPVSAALTGDLVYVSPPTSWKTEIGWFDSTGARIATLGPPGAYSEGRISPDGKLVAMGITNLETYHTDLWTVDVKTAVKRRLTLENTGAFGGPTWSPDGRRLAYVRWAGAGDKTLPSGIWQQDAIGGGAAELLWATDQIDNAELDWSPDGAQIVFSTFDAKIGKYGLWMLDVANRKAVPWLVAAGDASDPRFSPDGRFVAFASRVNGRGEIFLRRRDGAEQWQVTSDGGYMPRFAPSGKALYSQPMRQLFSLTEHEEPLCFLSVGTVQTSKSSRPRPHTGCTFRSRRWVRSTSS